MRNAPKIIILGQAGSGKSSLAMLLQELLSQQGFNATVSDSDTSDEQHVKANWRKRVKTLEGKTINIVPLQERRL